MGKGGVDYRAFFQTSAKRISEMHARIHETFKERSTPRGRRVWEDACAEFHSSYDALAFPGGYGTALVRLEQGDVEAIEAALVFLEVRPYFFRSGYMRETLMRRLKHVVMNEKQSKRFEAVREAQRQWRASRGRDA
jgi:hypothetical protein